jgi:transcriptional regulator
MPGAPPLSNETPNDGAEFRGSNTSEEIVEAGILALMPRMPRHSEKPSGDAALLQGTLDMLILRIAALRPIHGYALLQRIQQLSNDALQIRQGSLYPALYRLEERGWLKSDWQAAESGREAKFYSLTKVGRRQLEAEKASWKRLCEAISLVLETAD